ncbi:DMT family transporter [Variovorax sp. LARHSF232]
MHETRKIHPATGVAMVLLAAALWGTTGTAQAFTSGQLSAAWFGALRLVVAALFFATYAWATRDKKKAPPPARLPLAGVLAAGVCMALYNLAFFAGVRQTGVALGTAVALGSGPLWAGILQALITRRLPLAAWWLGTAVAVAGGVLMTLSGSSAADLAVSSAGIALCLVAGLSYAIYTLVNKELVHRASAASITFSAFSVAAVLAVPAAWIDGGTPSLTWPDLGAVLYVGVATAGVAYLLFSLALRHISAATGVTLALGEPVVAFMLAVLVVGERPGMPAFGGLLMVVAGVLVVVRAELRQPRPLAAA